MAHGCWKGLPDQQNPRCPQRRLLAGWPDWRWMKLLGQDSRQQKWAGCLQQPGLVDLAEIRDYSRGQSHPRNYSVCLEHQEWPGCYPDPGSIEKRHEWRRWLLSRIIEDFGRNPTCPWRNSNGCPTCRSTDHDTHYAGAMAGWIVRSGMLIVWIEPTVCSTPPARSQIGMGGIYTRVQAGYNHTKAIPALRPDGLHIDLGKIRFD